MDYLRALLKTNQVLIIAAIAVVSLATYTALLVTSHGGTANENLFAGFSKLVVSSANAQDNFTLEPTRKDSLGVSPEATYELKSKEPVDTNLIKESLKLDPPVAYSVKKISDTEWSIIPREPLPPDTALKVVLATSYTTEAGEQKEYDYAWAYQVRNTFRVVNSIPRDTATGVPLNSGIELTFSHDGYRDFSSHFKIEPTVAGRFEQHGRTTAFVPNSGLLPGTVYTVTVGSGLPLEGSDEKLASGYTFAFETAQAGSQYNSRNWLSIASAFVESPSSEQPSFQIYARGIDSGKVPARVYRFGSWQQYLESVRRRDQIPWWASSKDSHLESAEGLTQVLSTELLILNEKQVQFVRLPSKLDRGYYLVELDGPGGRVQAWLQVNDLAAFYTITKTDTLFWINDPGTHRPVEGATISIVDTDYSYRTDGGGVARFAMPEEIDERAADRTRSRRDYFRISRGDENLIVPASPISSRYSWDRGSEADRYWNYLYTDRPLYQATDTIRYWGILKDRGGQPVAEKVTVALYKYGYMDYYYRPVLVEERELELSPEGSYTGEVAVKNLRPDYYTLEVRVGGKAVTSRSVTIKPYTKPAYSLTLTPDRKYAFAGETVHLKVGAAFFEGTPVPNLPLVLQMPEGEYSFTTDANGEANLTYDKAYEPCQQDYSCWPKYAYLSIRPQSSELAEISAEASVRFYGPKVYAAQEVSYPEAGVASVTFSTKFIDFNAIANDDWQARSSGERPAPGTKIEAKLTKITYRKVETGTGYDFVSKRTYTNYRYDHSESVEDTFTAQTDADGRYTYRKQIEPNTSYRLSYKVYDADGRYDSSSAYLYYYDGQRTWNYSAWQYGYYRLELPKVKAFKVGEKVETTFVGNDAELPPAPGGYLYLQYQNGLREHAVADSSRYSFNFDREDIPNVGVEGIYFNGATYIRSSVANINFDTSERALKITISSDRASYKPGDEARLSFTVRDRNDQPVQAELSVNLVDEAFYAVADESANPLSVIYSNVGFGIVTSRTTHVVAQDPFGGAEKGGCFLAGTSIDMADSRKKKIEAIAVGDEIITFSDPTTRQRVTGRVTKVWEHAVAEHVVINGSLRVTPEHMVYANGRFKDVASLERGNWLLGSDGRKVYIETIERRYGLAKAYNFEVEPQHTYFAGGFYVHNEKGGGPRELFVDTAMFKSVRTNGQGRAEVTLKLPDNITSWRVTAQAVGDGIEVGVATKKVPVSLPVFADVSIGDEYLAADQPVARLRAFGTALGAGDRPRFSIEASSLGLERSQPQEAPAFQGAYFPLPKLTIGTHRIIYNLESSKGRDSVRLPLNVIQSRTAAQVGKDEKLSTASTVQAGGDGPVTVTLLDLGQSKLFRPLQRLSWSPGGRIDEVMPSQGARELLAKYYDQSYYGAGFQPFDYQTNRGGLTLLPYSSEDLELSARVAIAGAEKFDRESLAQYFYRALESQASGREDVSYALTGLAALGKPVLPQLSSWLTRTDLSPKEHLYLALAAYELGAKQWSRDLYLDTMGRYAQTKAPEISLRVGESNDDVFHATALAAVLAASLDAPEAEGLWLFVTNNQRLSGDGKNSENLFNLEKLSYLSRTVAKLKPSPAKVRYSLKGQERTVEISGGRSHSFQLYGEEAGQLKFLEVTGNVGLNTSQAQAIEAGNVAVDSSIGVRREYYVNGVRTDTFAETDLVEVRLYTTFQGSALGGLYQLTDTLPSGLEAMTKFSGPGSRNCDNVYPYGAADQVVRLKISKDWRGCGGYLKYFAHVKNRGRYVAEPAIIQSAVNPGFINFSAKSTVEIN